MSDPFFYNLFRMMSRSESFELFKFSIASATLLNQMTWLIYGSGINDDL